MGRYQWTFCLSNTHQNKPKRKQRKCYQTTTPWTTTKRRAKMGRYQWTFCLRMLMQSWHSLQLPFAQSATKIVEISPTSDLIFRFTTASVPMPAHTVRLNL